jgi:hypothetical protein
MLFSIATNMRQILVISIALFLSSCNYERIFISDVDKLVANQVENNRYEIDRIGAELKDWKIDKRKKNITLLSHLDEFHNKVLSLNDSIDIGDKDSAIHKAIDFIAKNFTEIDSFNEIPLEIDKDTPRSLIKLHISKLEALLIGQHRHRYDYGDVKIHFDHITIRAFPSKTLIKNGEALTGQLIVIAEPAFEASKKIIKKMTLNGQEVRADKNGWNFEIRPTVKGNGLKAFELKSEAILEDTILTGTQLIYVQN